jgi:hypothetical protein
LIAVARGHFAALLAGTMSRSGPRLHVWTPAVAVRVPVEVMGSPQTAAGVMRFWIVDGALLTEQALFFESATDGIPRGVSNVFLTWGERSSEGPTPAAAVRNLIARTHTAPTDYRTTRPWQGVGSGRVTSRRRRTAPPRQAISKPSGASTPC